ncbi:MAG: VWA domain-containing protein, partial [Dehalococcoidia bacterium]|nr:VWA domain-containing protein [Dehalococcoidia bacterium]
QIAGARDIQEGIAYGQGEIKIGGRPGARGALVMLTDGAHNQPGDPAGEAEAARAYGTEVFAVGVGPGPDMAELDAVAAGQAFSVSAFDELAGILERLVQAVCPDLPVGGVSQAPYPEPPDSPEASGPDGRESTVLGVAGLPETGSGLPEDWPDRAAKLAAQGLAGMGSALLLIGVTYYVARRREQR